MKKIVFTVACIAFIVALGLSDYQTLVSTNESHTPTANENLMAAPKGKQLMFAHVQTDNG